MDQNLISGTLTPEDAQACKDALEVLFTKMPFLSAMQNVDVSFAKYSQSPRQEFAIVFAEDFRIEDIRFNIDASAVLQKQPDIVYIDRYTNNGPIEQQHKFILTESYKETSNFNRKTSYNVNISTEVKTKVPFIASGKINSEVGAGQEFTYGKSEEKTITLNRGKHPIKYLLINSSLTLAFIISVQRFQTLPVIVRVSLEYC